MTTRTAAPATYPTFAALRRGHVNALRGNIHQSAILLDALEGDLGPTPATRKATRALAALAAAVNDIRAK
ncbi:MAG TPA: hypothetical protein PKC67_09950 [Kiritimatiellia bacterium]|nr:hypothetical protein [Kiritimatiellia bacterium]HMP34662.1 hypothetical protein [Kiritimatiellia bacterium]